MKKIKKFKVYPIYCKTAINVQSQSEVQWSTEAEHEQSIGKEKKQKNVFIYMLEYDLIRDTWMK